MSEDTQIFGDADRENVGQQTSGRSRRSGRSNLGAPSTALSALSQNPKMISEFETKYGYRPEGY